MGYKRVFLFFAIIILLSFISINFDNFTGKIVFEEKNNYQFENTTLLRVIDGDTIEVNLSGSKESVRLLGINTPEKKYSNSKESINFLKQFEGKEIQLLRDWENEDKYYRKLRYLFYNNHLINIEILEKGLANTYYTSNLKYEKQLISAENQARILELGIWQKSENNCSKCIVLNSINAKEEYFIIENKCNFNCNLLGWFVKDAGRNIINLKSIKANYKETYFNNNSKEIWNDDTDKFFIYDSKLKLVYFEEY